MGFLRRIGIDATVAAAMGLAAFVLSVLTGVVSGIEIETVIIRSILFLIVFAALGFGAMFVLKKYVPEIYGPIQERWEDQSGPALRETAPPQNTEPSIDEPISADDAGKESVAVETPTEAFNELKGDGLAQVSARGNARVTAEQNRGKLGRHIIEKEKVAQYEPKIMAQAIRTMMSKDME